VVIDRLTWRLHGDLLAWLVTTYPGLSAAEYEAGFRLLVRPGATEAAGDAVEVLLSGCIPADNGEGE
jgi:hypothetical protein